MKKILNRYTFKDIELIYVLNSQENFLGMCLLPKDAPDISENRQCRVRPLIQYKLAGDVYSSSYSGGTTMLHAPNLMKYVSQSVTEKYGAVQIDTQLEDKRRICAVNTVVYHEGDEFFSVKNTLINNSGHDIILEMLSTFSIYGLSPFLDGNGTDSLYLHRFRSRWSMEGRHVRESAEDLLLESDWTKHNMNTVRFGQVGSMPVKGYFPCMAIEDSKNGIFWGVQMGSSASWQMEVSRSDDGLEINGGHADREFGHWTKTVHDGDSFESLTAYVSVCRGDIDEICQRLTQAQERRLCVPESEKSLPVIFNEYCTTWGEPSYDNIKSILSAIDGKGIDYFVIDCGWYKSDGIPWDKSMGDYIPSPALFPNGIKAASELIHSYGMKAGIWFEAENVAEYSEAYKMTEHLLKRDGVPLTTETRRFRDMNDPWVESFLTRMVIDFLNENEFDYIKIDYNETIGIGVDNEDSLGEGLRLNMKATERFFERLRSSVKDVIIENCASGGNRLEPVFMGLSSMASFSDAHECREIPIIAANLHRLILPRQSQIWCVIRRGDSLKRIAYSVSAAFLGRLCLSGDVTDLSAEQWRVIEDGIDFYKKISPIIKSGRSKIIRHGMHSFRDPHGYQALIRSGDDGRALAVVHTFGNSPRMIEIRTEYNRIAESYCFDADVTLDNGVIRLENAAEFSGMAFILEK